MNHQEIIDKIVIEIFCYLTAIKDHKANSLFFKFKDFGLTIFFKNNEPKIINCLTKYLISSKDNCHNLLIKSIAKIIGVTANTQAKQSSNITFKVDTLFNNYYVDIKDLKSDYRQLANKYHPDKFANLDDEFQQLAHKRFIAIKDYYEYRLNRFNNPF